MDSRDIKGNIGSGNFDTLSKKIHAITRRKFGHLVNILPNKVENQSDLRNIDTAMSRAGRSPQDLYEDTKKLLMSIDEQIERATNVEMNSIKFSLESEELISKYKEIKNSHRSVRYKLEDLLDWVEDDSLLSTVLFHSKIADETVYSLSEDELEESLSDEETIEIELEEGQEFTKQDKAIVKAMMLLSLEPLLVWAALYAYVRDDYRFILRYETEVESSARVIRRSAPPEKVEKILREPA